MLVLISNQWSLDLTFSSSQATEVFTTTTLRTPAVLSIAHQPSHTWFYTTVHSLHCHRLARAATSPTLRSAWVTSTEALRGPGKCLETFSHFFGSPLLPFVERRFVYLNLLPQGLSIRSVAWHLGLLDLLIVIFTRVKHWAFQVRWSGAGRTLRLDACPERKFTGKVRGLLFWVGVVRLRFRI